MRSLEGLEANLTEQDINMAAFPMVIQYNKRDIQQAANVHEMKKLINHHGVPDFETVATQGQGVFEVFKELAKGVIRDYANSL
jgi:signal recognition particle receptor subunit beta